MGTTSLVEELTKTYFPPPLTHLSAQSLCPALAPFAPQPLSLIHPVHESAFTGMLKAKNKTAAIARVENTFFMFIPLPLGAEILILSPGFVNSDHEIPRFTNRTPRRSFRMGARFEKRTLQLRLRLFALVLTDD